MSELRSRPVVLMQPGPLHLFWATGVFYYWELAPRFDFVLLVPDNYRGHAEFQKIAALPTTLHVEYMSQAGLWARHFGYLRQFGALLRRYLPRLVLLHNRSFLANQYLLQLSGRIVPQSYRLYYQNGRMSLRWKEDFAFRRAMMIEALVRRRPVLARSMWLAGKLVDLRNALATLINYKLLPLATLGAVLRPPVNVLTGRVDRAATIRSSASERDVLLAYMDNEIAMYERQGMRNIVRVRHPMQKVGRDVIEFLHGTSAEQEVILILPSHGFTSQLLENGWSQQRVVEHVAGRWREAILALMAKFPGYRVVLKTHPGAQDDPIWMQILASLRDGFPELRSLPARDSAEVHVVASKVIASDVSTVLWWAALWGGKVSISFDIFGYPGGDELGGYEDIVLVQSLDQLKSIPNSQASAGCARSAGRDVPQLAGALAGLN